MRYRFAASWAAVLVASSLVLSVGVVGAATAKQPAMGTATLVLGDQDGSPGFTENFNPLSVNSLEGWWYMYEPMYAVDGLTGQATPWLATHYRWLNPKALAFTLRSGVKWSNGAAFSASDVVFTFNLLKKYPALDLNGIWKYLVSVSSSGQTVTFKFKSVNIPLWQYLATQPIVYAPQFENVNPVKFTDNNPIVTGPYVVDKFASSQYTLKANPSYWQKAKIHVPEIQEIALSNNTTSDLQMSEGMFDEAVLFEPNIQKVYVAKNPKYYHFWFPLASPVALYMNLTKKPFSEVQFRQAMAYAINKEQIYKAGEFGYEPPANQSLLPPTLWKTWLNKSLASKYAYNYNPKKALSLLASIGYKKNSSGELIGPDGKQLSFTLEVPTGWTDWVEDTQIIAHELSHLGIRVIPETPSVATDYSDVQTGHFQTALVYGWQESNPYFIYDFILSSSASAPIGQVANFNSNSERWNDPTTNRLINEYAQTSSPAKQHQIVNQLQQILFTKLPIVALVAAASWNEFQTNHYVNWPSQSNPYANPSASYPDTLLVLTHLIPAK